jgi:hypothetical protein
MQPSNRGSIPATPRWVKIFGIIAIVLALFVLFVVLTGVGGPHGPGRHVPSGDVGGHTPWELLILFGVLAVAVVALNSRPPWLWLTHAAREWPWNTLASRLRKLALVAHVGSSVGSLGAVTAFMTLAVAGLMGEDTEQVRACYVAMEMIARFAILPLIIASLLTGLVSSLGTTWGLVRHYWVVVKLLLNVVVLIVLLLQMEPISYMAAAAADARLSGVDVVGLRKSLAMHAAGGLVALIAATVLGTYKPRGLTPYGAFTAAREP